MNVLLIHPEAEVRKALLFTLETELSAKVVAAENGASGRAEAEGKKFVPDVIVAENKDEISSFFLNAEPNQPASFVLFEKAGDKAPPAKAAKLDFLGYALLDNLGENLLRILRAKATPASAASEESFARISTELLLRINPLAADIFIQLSSSHHIKLFHKGDTFDEGDLAKYRDKKKLDFLYIRQPDCQLLSKKLLEEVNKILAAAAPGDAKQTNTIGAVVETIHELIDKVGVTEEVQQAVKGSVQATMKAMGDFPDLAAIMKVVADSNGKYIGRHTMLLTNIACAIACAMDWYSDATFEKLTMAAFLHDAALSDHDLCAVKDLSEFEKVHKGKFNLAQIQSYKSHPERALLLLGHFKEMPAEVDKIIVQHHEHPMGSGFPAALSANYISPLSSLFIIAHDLTDYVLEHPNDFDVDDFLALFEKKYTSSHFKKIAKVLSEVKVFGD